MRIRLRVCCLIHGGFGFSKGDSHNQRVLKKLNSHGIKGRSPHTRRKETKISDKLTSPLQEEWGSAKSHMTFVGTYTVLKQTWYRNGDGARLDSNSIAFNCFLWSGKHFNLTTDWTDQCICLYDQEIIASVVLLRYWGLQRIEETLFLGLEAAIIANIREYVVCVSDLTELANIPRVYVKQIKC